MFGPDWEEGCKSCSYLADHFDGANWHLPHRDVSFVVISRAPLPKLEAYKKRMGWRFKWLSSYGNDFNFDYHVSFTKEDEKKNEAYYNYGKGEFITDELPGLSVFCKDENGEVFHTYSTYARGLDILVGAYNFLDLVPKGRDEDHLDFYDGVGTAPRRILRRHTREGVSNESRNALLRFTRMTRKRCSRFIRMFSAGSFRNSRAARSNTGWSRPAMTKIRESMAALTRPREGQSSGTLNTIAVESLDRTISKIEQRGGKICVPKMAIPNVGWLAYAEDPAGNVFGIIEPDTDAK